MNKKNLLHLACLVFLLLIGRTFILYLIEPVDYSVYFNQTLKNKAEADNGQIEMLFLGDSRPQRTFDPAVFEKTLDIGSAYNASSGLQPIEASYYMLKEITERYHPKYAVLGISSGTLFKNNSTIAKVIVLDRLHGFNKLRFLLTCFTPDEYLSAVSLCYRFRDNFTLSAIRENLREKKDLRENHYARRWSDPDLYTDSGFIYSYQTGEIGNMADSRINFQKMSPEKIEYLEKIVDFCKEKGIRLFLVTAPCSIMNIYHSQNYQEYIDYVEKYAAGHDLPYVNLNYLRGREDWLGDDLMFDSGHVNGEGAELVSEKYAQVLKAELAGEEIPDIFYRDLSELKADVRRIVGIRADIYISKSEANIRITSRQSEGIDPLYRVQVSPDGKDYTPVTDWNGNTDLKADVSGFSGSVYFMIESRTGAGDAGPFVTYRKTVE